MLGRRPCPVLAEACGRGRGSGRGGASGRPRFRSWPLDVGLERPRYCFPPRKQIREKYRTHASVRPMPPAWQGWLKCGCDVMPGKRSFPRARPAIAEKKLREG